MKDIHYASDKDENDGLVAENNRTTTTKQERERLLHKSFLIMMLLFIFVSLISIILVNAIHINKKLNQLLPPNKGYVLENHGKHHLETNTQARKASKKLYELLTDFKNSYYEEESMVLGTHSFSKNTYSRQPYVSNGYIGSRLPNIGFGYAVDEINLWTNSSIDGALNNGWPLRNRRFAGSFLSDFYCLQKKLNSTNFPELDDIGYSTVISSIPDWTNLKILIDDKIWFTPQDISADDINSYSQNLSMQNGIVTTGLSWLNSTINFKSNIFAHRKIYPLGLMSLEISLNLNQLPNNFDSYKVNVFDFLDFNTSHRTILRDKGNDTDGIFVVVEPENVPYSNAVLYSISNVNNKRNSFPIIDVTDDAISQSSDTIILTRESPNITIYKYTGIMSTEFNDNQNNDYLTNLDTIKEIVINAQGKFDKLLSSHIQAWNDLYSNAFIEIPSDSILELTARSSLYHLLANTRMFNVSHTRGLPLPVSGLSSDSYGGMVFWDADVWMQPAILPFFPEIAKNINNYRNSTHEQAKLNAKQYGFPGAVYPWTSGRYANCTSTGPCIDYEYHINVDVAMASFAIYMNGGDGIDDEYLRYTTWPMVRDAAEFFSEYVKFNNTIGMYETYNLTDPDEFANNINNGAFTNAGIKTLMKWASDIGNHLNEYVNPKWIDISHNICIPRSYSNITLEYSGMNSSVEIKQADVTLMVYPLGYITDESILSNSIRDLYYYSEKQSASGPAMTYPVFVAAAAGLLNHGSSSQSYLYKSVLPYLRAPFAQFSEQSDDNFLTNGLTQPAFPFLTANGGFLQSILFGLTGIRYSYEVNSDTKKIERLMKFNPVELPLLPGGIAIRNFKYMGQVLDIVIGDHNGTIIHKSGDLPIRIKVPNRSLIHDRDIIPFTGRNRTERIQRRDTFSLNDQNERIKLYGTYYTLYPYQELVLPLFKPDLNIRGNIAESKQITNLTAGVAGDVAFSAVDGNNYTHWQPFDKSKVAKLLIDLGENNQQEIKGGMILWGQRPAKNISLTILPHTEKVEQLFANVTDFIENSIVPTNDTNVLELLEDIDSVNETVVYKDFCKNGKCDDDLKALLGWKTNNLDEMIQQIPDIDLIKNKFITILDNFSVIPSEPYYFDVFNESLIEILPSNITEFSINYDTLQNDANDQHKNSSEWRKARFIILNIDGSYDNDLDMKGGTVREIVLF